MNDLTVTILGSVASICITGFLIWLQWRSYGYSRRTAEATERILEELRK